VGQGDAILTSTPQGEKWLIDGGVLNKFNNAGLYRIIPFLERTMTGKIDYALVSHYDADHFGGIAVLLKENKIKTLILPPKEEGEGADDALEKLAGMNGVNIIFARDTVIHSGGAAFYLLTPSEGHSGEEKTSNERSISLKLVYGKTAFLFTGDAPQRIEENLIRKYGNFLEANIFKAGHHGSKSSTGDEFLRRVSPEVVVFSSGLGNRYNHPAREVLLRAKDAGAQIARTDYEGALIFTSDGISVQKRVWK
jgi:competence protein ComEC